MLEARLRDCLSAITDAIQLVELLRLMCFHYALNLIRRKPLRVAATLRESKVGDRILRPTLYSLLRIRVVSQDLMTTSSAGSACVFLCHGPDRGLALCRTRDHALSFVDSDNRTLINKCVKEAPRRFVFLVFLHGHWAHGRLLLRCEEVTRRSGKVFRHANF